MLAGEIVKADVIGAGIRNRRRKSKGAKLSFRKDNFGHFPPFYVGYSKIFRTGMLNVYFTLSCVLLNMPHFLNVFCSCFIKYQPTELAT